VQPRQQQGRAPGEARRQHGAVVVQALRIAQAPHREVRPGGELDPMLAGAAQRNRRVVGMYRVDTTHLLLTVRNSIVCDQIPIL
jgi:hypothetical protein